MFFTSIPTLDFTTSSFGGVDLTSVPIAFSWLNDTAFWLLEEVSQSVVLVSAHYTYKSG